jgi:hypothetical protein
MALQHQTDMKEMNNKIFYQNLPLLENIFGKTEVANKTTRLMEIFQSTETSWEKNLDRLADKKVQNILIAEAAPWSDSGEIHFFYNQIESSYHQRIWRAFFPFAPIPSENDTAFNMLADKNFLLIDTIPFSMSYSGLRNHSDYFGIIANSIDWWTEKLKSDKITFTEKVKVAFAFKVNGLSVIRATGGQLKLKDGQIIKLNEKNIAADGSGYTNSERLRTIYLRN